MEEFKPPPDDDQLIQNLKNKDEGDFSPAFVQLDQKMEGWPLQCSRARKWPETVGLCVWRGT